MAKVKGYLSLDEGLKYLIEYVRPLDESGMCVTVFCDEGMTLSVEQSICKEMGGSFNVSVTTFNRFQRDGGRRLSKQGSVMAVRKIMSDHREELNCLSAGSGGKRSAAAVYEVLSRLYSANIMGDELLKARDMAGHRSGMLQKKLQDLALISNEYISFLETGNYLDENRFMHKLSESIGSKPAIREGAVVFFGFSSLTEQELGCMKKVCDASRNVLGLFPEGGKAISGSEGTKTWHMYSDQAINAFRDRCGAEIWETECAVRRSRTAESLRETLYDIGVFAWEDAQRMVTGRIVVDDPCRGGEEEELRRACARISEHVRKDGYRYGEIAVLVSDMGRYSPFLRKVFGEYGIPYFANEKKALSDHPFMRFALAVLRAASENLSPSSVQLVASSPYFGDSGEYRNYLAKYCNYQKGADREILESSVKEACEKNGGDADKCIEYLKGKRERLLEAVGCFSAEKAICKDFCDGVRALRIRYDRDGKVTKQLADACGDGMLREFLSDSKGRIDAVLDEMERVLGDMPMNVSEFASLLEEGMSASKVSLLPVCPDEVFVGDIAQDRVCAKKMVLALGMTDDVPGRCQDSAILSSGDIRILTEGQTAKTKEETEIIRRFSAMDGAERVNERTREAVCMNLCAFSERLYLSSPLGQETEESEILRYIRKAYVPEEADNDRIFLGNCAAAVPMAREQRRLENLCEDASVPREEIALAAKRKHALEKARQGSPEMSDGLRETREWRGREMSDCISRGQDLFFRRETVSPTLLETYCKCPFWNFAQRGLRLKEREETAMRATDSGDFVHEVMKEVGALIKEGQVTDETDCKKKAEEIARDVLKEPQYSFLTDTKAGRYTAERLVGETAEIAAGLYRQIANSGFEIDATELKIDETKTELKGHEIGISGRIDRVDKGKNDEGQEYIRIVDYKTGSYDTSAAKYYTGEKLQLELYMASVLGDSVPAGIYYFPARMDYVKSGDRKKNVDLFRMDGFTNDSIESMRMSDNDFDADKNKKSRYVKADLSNRNGGMMSEDTLRDFIAYSVLCGRKAKEEIGAGFVAPTTIEGADACSYCPYRGMCASMGNKTERKSVKVKCIDVARTANAALAGNGAEAEDGGDRR